MTKVQTAIAVVIGLGIAGFAGVRGIKHLSAAPSGPEATAGRSNNPVPVRTARVQKKDVAVVVEGLGTVTSLATVTVKTLVDGRLERIVFKEGAEVKQGDLLAIVDPRPFQVQVEQGQAALERDEANHVNSRLNLERYEKLRQSNLIPQQQVDDQRSSVKQLSAAMLADKAQIEQGKLQLDYAHIRSPVNGVTGIRLVDQGNIVHPSDPGGIVVVTQLDPISVVFTLPEDVLPRVQRALANGKPEVEAFARNGNERLGTGALESLDNQVNVQTATIRLKALFTNGDKRLWPNQFVKARLHVDTLLGATVVPTPSVQRGTDGAFVYVVEGGIAAAKPIEVASVEGDETVIAKGVQPGDTVVTDGQNLLRPGAKVTPRDAPASASGSSSAAGAPPSAPAGSSSAARR
jgi:multidrug efflux system membrane fusion protein